jgi:tetratricopeptide (TPR) repeat protein
MVRRAPLLLLFLLGLLLLPSSPVGADDVPDEVRRFYEQALEFVAKGDFKKAYSAISKGKAKEPLSVDFWELYVRIWRALEKDEDVLWERIIGKLEEKHPDTPVFLLLRARLATEVEERIEHLTAAIEKDPDVVETRLLLARAYLDNEDEGEAEAILDQILEDDPANELALVTKGDLMIASGFSRSALEFAEETLAEHDLPGMHDLRARALLLVAENDESVLEQALEAARAAVAGRGDPAYVITLSEILDRSSKAEEAVALLKSHGERTGSPEIAARLGRLAFREGDYEAAIPGLSAGAAVDAAAAKALVLCHARLGETTEAREALEGVLASGPQARPFAAAVELLLGDADAARKHLEGVDAEGTETLLARAEAWAGASAAVLARGEEEAASGSRGGEEWLVLLSTARILEKLGDKASAARKALLDGRIRAAQAKTPTATVPDMEPSVAATSYGFMYRYTSYRRSLGNDFFSPESILPIAPSVIDETPAIGIGVVASSSCERDPQRVFVFNAQKVEGNITIEMNAHDDVWQAAEAAFEEGAAALTAGDWATADEAFGRALEQEPTWGRAQLFQATAKALGGTDLAGAAALATEGVKTLPDDWSGRALGVLIRTLAGEDASSEIAALSERMESFAPRHFEEL